MVGQVIGIFFISLVANSQYFLGTSFIGRPIVTGMFVGLLFGNLKEGLLMGAASELIFMGLMGIGASVPPDEVIGGILGTAFALKNGLGVSAAITLVLPIASLSLIVKNILYVLVFPAMTHRADHLADEGKITRAGNMHIWMCFLQIAVLTIVTTFAFAVGSNAVGNLIKMIPKAVTDGLTIATYILPAIGFGMLINMTYSKKVAPFFFLGFVCAAYLKLNTIATAIIGAICAAIMYIIFDKVRNNSEETAAKGDEIYDDF